MSSKQQEYEVKLELFEGPLDLLLYLVNKSEVDIVDISVSAIVTQYLEYIDLIRDLNIDIASEYLHMASVLIRLKARELLPPDQNEVIEDEDGIYNREQLVAQLLEYKKFKEAASAFKTFEAEQFGAFSRGCSEVLETVEKTDEIDLGNISIFDLLKAFKKVLERTDEEKEFNHVVEYDNVKIDDKIEYVLMMLTDRGEVQFEELFASDHRKIVMVVTFMALLELVKMQEITFRQESNFGSIFVTANKNKSNGTIST